MGEFLSAGVFTEEVRSGETAILGVSTSNFATAGWLPRGEENKAILCTSLPDYFRKFGSYWKHSDVPLAVTAFFKNGGSRAFVVRVCPDDAAAATADEFGLWAFRAISRGAWGNQLRVVVRGNQNQYNHATGAYAKYDVEIQEESAVGAGDFEVVEAFEAVDLENEDAADYFLSVVNDEESGSNLIRVEATAPGIPAVMTPQVFSGQALGTGDGTAASFPFAGVSGAAAHSLRVSVDGVPVATDDGRGRFKRLAGVSGYSGVSGTVDYEAGDAEIAFTPAPAAGAAITFDYVQGGEASVAYAFTGGTDGTEVTRAQLTEPGLALDKKGLYALADVEEILNIGLPDFPGDPIVASDLIDYCEGRGDCFAILDTERGIDAQDAKTYRQVTLNSLSNYGALYWPGVKIPDPLKGGRPRAMSPVGHIAGVYARTDTTRNVGKAPGGTVDGRLNFCLGLERNVSKGERDLIYPVNINPLIDSPATGRAVWGVRTLEISGDYNLVQVRRLFIFLRKSVHVTTQDLVFEPVGGDLFSVVALRLGSFLNRLTSEGYFASRVPSQAFRLTVDASNNTPATIAARQLITDVLVAPQTPGEFIRFRFQRALNALT